MEYSAIHFAWLAAALADPILALWTLCVVLWCDVGFSTGEKKYIIHLRLGGLSIPHLVQSPESRPANYKILKQIILDVFGLNFSPR